MPSSVPSPALYRFVDAEGDETPLLTWDELLDAIRQRMVEARGGLPGWRPVRVERVR